MPTEYDIYQRYIYSVITELYKLEYIKQEWDWDVKNGKFTIRIPMRKTERRLALLLTLRRKDNIILITDAHTNNQIEFAMMQDEGFKNYQNFTECLINLVEELSN